MVIDPLLEIKQLANCVAELCGEVVRDCEDPVLRLLDFYKDILGVVSTNDKVGN